MEQVVWIRVTQCDRRINTDKIFKALGFNKDRYLIRYSHGWIANRFNEEGIRDIQWFGEPVLDEPIWYVDGEELPQYNTKLAKLL